MSERILIATTNRGKVREFTELTYGLGLEFCTAADVGIDLDVDETGSTFNENAAIKAIEYSLATGMLAIADDSGLVIDALDGRPGVLSARYGGLDLDFEKRMRLVLDEMDDARDRSARFVCSIALADSDGNVVVTVDGKCEGTIAAAITGDGGFGYDPIFIPTGFDQTFGELSSDIKNSISHRREAIRKIIPFLQDFIAV